MNRIRIMRQEHTLAFCEADGEAQLYYHGTYQQGDTIAFESATCYVTACVDHTLPAAHMYLPYCKWVFQVPLEGDLLRGYPPYAFLGDRHLITLSNAEPGAYRNLAYNPADQRHNSGAYPHASANVETRDESIFFARNTIDGLHIANSHGQWPYLSWGIGGRADAAIRLDFGREVAVDTMVLYLRADFKHSGYWVRGTVQLSDGYEKTFPLLEIDSPQTISLDGWHTISWASLSHLIKNDTPSPYQSLRQWEMYGKDI